MTKIQNRQAIIMEYVKGENIGDLLLNNLNEAEHYIGLCVNEQKKDPCYTCEYRWNGVHEAKVRTSN